MICIVIKGEFVEKVRELYIIMYFRHYYWQYTVVETNINSIIKKTQPFVSVTSFNVSKELLQNRHSGLVVKASAL